MVRKKVIDWINKEIKDTEFWIEKHHNQEKDLINRLDCLLDIKAILKEEKCKL